MNCVMGLVKKANRINYILNQGIQCSHITLIVVLVFVEQRRFKFVQPYAQSLVVLIKMHMK